ncbi:radical SAM protein [Mycoplasmatota bacterium]|nr:radical SAM protein [Mycoplasmatota bacterium]
MINNDIKNVLFVTFDFHEINKPIKSVAVATLESYLKENIKPINIDAFSFNMNSEYTIIFDQLAALNKMLVSNYDFVCISFYSWSMRFIDNIIDLVKSNNPLTQIIAGGYEVGSRTVDSLINQYSKVDKFIIGFAEESLLEILTSKSDDKVYSKEVDNKMIPCIYSNGIIDINDNSVVRIETKRGCPANCSFCSYKSNDHSKITCHDIEKVKLELRYLNEINVQKVNIIDPIFSIKNYLEILEYLLSINFKPIISFQMKFEIFYNLIKKSEGLLEKLAEINCTLEFGLQSISRQVLDNVERVNDFTSIEYVIRNLNEFDIDYELSIIRGLPGETCESYEAIFEWMKRNNCKRHVVYPLSLLKNTKMDVNSNTLTLGTFDQNGITYVNSSYSYTLTDYLQMMEYEE